MEKTTVGVFVEIPIATHTKLQTVLKDGVFGPDGITIKMLNRQLLEWAGEVGADEIIRCGVCLPIWSKATVLSTQVNKGSSD